MEGSPRIPEGFANVIDVYTFDQILEMDDDKERSFSRSIVETFFDQAETTFGKMDNALAENDLETLSQLGHFLKGSSASLGLTKVQNACSEIQHLGRLSPNDPPLDHDGLEALLKRVRTDYDEIHSLLEAFYN
ncbi:Multistep phosphorelay regulator 1 [Wickerhamiella sorbophila]|uniref:Multistep phosphorelay regulator 1 n=1 Tax=Wickerhamiella sorbophila TaxID=45607 RepID=A0A2T0FMS0_9ASCO|nr:Multistep phosphorelay regulator 1 [Wickerhamiella sorbophila]PRT56303.1 Multistep phosphorelay regulator 1 [Wickerhamiella sorbophila]